MPGMGKRKAKNDLRADDMYLMSTLSSIMNELEHLQNSFDNVIDPELVDSYTYEILALKTKYCYYLNLCKDRGLIGFLEQPSARMYDTGIYNAYGM